MILRDVLEEVVELGKIRRSDVLPNAWAEERRTMGGGESRFKGRFSYRLTPYAREMVDCWYPGNPAREIWVMKGAQVGISKGVIENGINYAMSEHPGNILYLIGNSELLPTTVRNLDMSIDGCGNRHLIRSQSNRKKGQKTGDTDVGKEFPAGMLRLGSATKFRSHRQFDAMYGVYDDYEAAKLSSGEAGDTTELILQRHAAYWNVRKVFFLSSPEVHGNSNIERGYLRGDQRRFFIPCPKCGDYITLEWSWNTDTNIMMAHDVEPPKHWKPVWGDVMAGMYWKADSLGRPIRSSVGYVCQSCGNFFDDRNKLDWLNMGLYRPTATAMDSGLVSFHISSLYAPPGMKGWLDYVEQYIKANPQGQAQDRERFKTFMNVGLGMTHREVAMGTEAKGLMRNTRNYKPGTVPEKRSMEDGNGRIVMLTLAVDLNGTVKGMNGAVYDDARVDWEVLAYSENGATYSVQHGSIGTFVPREGDAKHHTDRPRMSYVHGAKNSVWPVLKELIERKWQTDNGRTMYIAQSGIDCGHYTTYAYEFLDMMPESAGVIGLRGEKEGDALIVDRDVKWFKKGSERNDYYLLDVSRIKDRLADLMVLPWNPSEDTSQPSGFMNYPTPMDGLYTFPGYFEHYESEQRVVVAAGKLAKAKVRWERKNSSVQNHFWDCFDEKTEVLTSNGWKYFKDVTENDELGTVNLDTDTMQFQKPTHLIDKHYEGEMVKIKGRKLDMCVTPGHRMVVYRKKHNIATKSGRMEDKPQIVLAKDLRITDCIKVTCQWDAKGDEYFTIPELRGDKNQVIATEKKIDAHTWAAFLALYVAEGNVHRAWNEKRGSWAHRVEISQNEGQNLEDIKEVCDKLPFKYNVYKSRGIAQKVVISQKQLYLALQENGCYSHCKTTGSWIKKQSASVIKTYLKYAILGDGHEDKNMHRRYYTISKTLADDIQELMLKAGTQANIKIRAAQKCNLSGTYNTRQQYHVTENKSVRATLRKADNTPIIQNIQYKGRVYCATVPNGTLICRREGKSFIAGNCRVYNMALREIFIFRLGQKLKNKEFGWTDYANAVAGGLAKMDKK